MGRVVIRNSQELDKQPSQTVQDENLIAEALHDKKVEDQISDLMNRTDMKIS